MRRLPAFLLATTALLAAPALAQESSQPALGDIIVTAQKRAQNLQDVPIAISAMSTDYLQKRGITSIDSLSGTSPNLRIGTPGGSRTTSMISIRGGVQTNPQLYFEPSVGLYMDGVYIAKAQGSIFDVADIERVEVLRGPQGTLYGRNAVAGAINVILQKPSGELGGRLEASYGNYDEKRVRGSLDLPRFGIFSLKISGQFLEHDGYYHVAGDPYTSEAASLNSKSGLVQLRAEPSDNLTLDYVFDISDAKTQGNPAIPIAGTDPFAPYVLKQAKRPKTVYLNTPNFENVRNWGHALTIALDTSFGTLKSITAIREQKSPQYQDLDGTPLDFGLVSRNYSKYRQLSEELQLTGSALDDKLNYVVGAYFFDDKGTVLTHQSFFFGRFITNPDYAFKTQAYAGYAQADYKLTDRLTLTAGIRYTHERKKIARTLTQETPGGLVPLVDLPFGATPPANFSKVSPAATIAYDLAPEVNVYFRYAQGFRSGGFNATATTAADVQRIFQPETQDTFELGLKSRLLDNKLQLNATLFQNNLRDLQLSVFVPSITAVSLLTNAGKARVRGLELEASAFPSDRLTLRASLGYLDAKYKEFIDRGVNVAANTAFPYAPKFTFATSLDWEAGDWSFGKLNLIADYRMRSAQYMYPDALVPAVGQKAAAATRAPDSQNLDLRAVLSDIPLSGNLMATLSVWGKNVLNERNPNFFINYGAAFSNLVTAYFPDPATYGATIGIKF